MGLSDSPAVAATLHSLLIAKLDKTKNAKVHLAYPIHTVYSQKQHTTTTKGNTMSKATRTSKTGDRVTVTDPKTRKPATGTVDWVSPTKGTIQIALDAGGYAYEYPEDDGTVTVKVTKTYTPSKPPTSEEAPINSSYGSHAVLDAIKEETDAA